MKLLQGITMLNYKLLLIAPLLTASLFAAEVVQEPHAEYIVEGEKIANTLLKTLGKNMKMHLKSEGLEGAAKFCNASAYDLTQSVSKKFPNVEVKRISLKYRNEANRPSKEEAVVLESLQRLKDVAAMPKYILQTQEEKLTYYKPLMINKDVCLKCHGNITKSKIATFMQEHYPADKATNYKMNDLRGAVVVTFKK